MVELADRLEGLFELFVIVEPAPHLEDQFATQAELACATAGIGDGQNRERVAFAAGALRAFGAMRANGPMQKRATQDLAGHGEAIEQLLARTKGLLMNHSYK